VLRPRKCWHRIVEYRHRTLKVGSSKKLHDDKLGDISGQEALRERRPGVKMDSPGESGFLRSDTYGFARKGPDEHVEASAA
jgi:hypothetical protein